MNPDTLHKQTREKNYCETHEMIHVKNAMGKFVCPFCVSNVDPMTAKYIAVGKRHKKEIECDSLEEAFRAAFRNKWTGWQERQIVDDDGTVVYDSTMDDPLDEWIHTSFQRFEHLKGE